MTKRLPHVFCAAALLTASVQLTAARPWIVANATRFLPGYYIGQSRALILVDIDGDGLLHVNVTSYSDPGFTMPIAGSDYFSLTRQQLESAGGFFETTSLSSGQYHDVRFSNCRGTAWIRLGPAGQYALGVLSHGNPPTFAPRVRPLASNVSVMDSYYYRTVSFTTDPCATTQWTINGAFQPSLDNLRSVSYYNWYPAGCWINNEWGTITMTINQNGSWFQNVYY